MANIIQDGSYVLAADTEEFKGFEQELSRLISSANGRSRDGRSPIQAACLTSGNGILWSP